MAEIKVSDEVQHETRALLRQLAYAFIMKKYKRIHCVPVMTHKSFANPEKGTCILHPTLSNSDEEELNKFLVERLGELVTKQRRATGGDPNFVGYFFVDFHLSVCD